MINLYDVIRKPIITESSSVAEVSGKYIFEVDTRSNKATIKLAVEKLFGVKVSFVNIINRKGKVKKLKNKTGKRADTKRAIVTLLQDSPAIDITGKLN